MNTDNLQQKTQVLSQVILLTQELYNSGKLTDIQKGLLETLIGAGIWYLPNSRDLFSGYISKNAYAALMADPLNTKLVEEHAFPRKMAGHFLFAPEMKEKLSDDGKGLEKLYKERFGKYNLVLKSENNKLKKFQKKGTFIDEETAYRLADIELVPFTIGEYKAYKRLHNSKRK